MAEQEWVIYVVDEVRDWIRTLEERDRLRVTRALDKLAERGPTLGRPLVDTLHHTNTANLKELRPTSGGHSYIRMLFAFDPWRSAIILVAGDKEGNWVRWYRDAIPLAEKRLKTYIADRAEEEGEA